MSKRLKKILWAVAALVAVTAVAGVLVLRNLDFVIRIAIEAVVGRELGLDTDVESVHLDRETGEFTLRNMVIANPDGVFITPHFASLGALDVEMDPDSLSSDVIEVKRIVLDDIHIYWEQGLMHSNAIEAIMRLRDGGAKEDSKKDEVRYRIDDLRVENIKVEFHATSMVLQRSLTSVTVEIPELTLKNLTSENARGLVVNEVMTKVIQPILKAASEKGREILLSKDSDLNTDEQLLKRVLEAAIKLQEGAMPTALSSSSQEPGALLQDVGNILRKALDEESGSRGDSREE